MEIGAHQTQPFTLWHRSTYPLSHAARGTTAVDSMRAHAAVRAGGPQLRTVVTSAVSALVHSGLMEIRHGQSTPSMDPEAYVVPTVVLSGKHSRRALCVAGSGQGRARLGPGPAGLRWLGRDAQIPSAPNDLPQCPGGCSCWLDAKPDLFTRSGVDLLPGTAGPADLCSYCVRPGLDVNRHGLPRLDAPARYVVYFQGVGPQGIAVMAARPGEDDLCALFHEANDYTSVVARCAQLTGPADQAPA